MINKSPMDRAWPPQGMIRETKPGFKEKNGIAKKTEPWQECETIAERWAQLAIRSKSIGDMAHAELCYKMHASALERGI